MYLQHRFDLLGSDWIKYDYNSSGSRKKRKILLLSLKTSFSTLLHQTRSIFGKKGLLLLPQTHKIRLLPIIISIQLEYKKIKQIRSITVEPECILINDSSTHPFRQNFNKFHFYSNGYGKLIKFGN